jgi:hypothetical protein
MFLSPNKYNKQTKSFLRIINNLLIQGVKKMWSPHQRAILPNPYKFQSDIAEIVQEILRDKNVILRNVTHSIFGKPIEKEKKKKKVTEETELEIATVQYYGKVVFSQSGLEIIKVALEEEHNYDILYIHFKDGILRIPVGRITGMHFLVWASQMKQQKYGEVPIEITLSYGGFTKKEKSKRVEVAKVAYVTFQVVNADKYLKLIKEAATSEKRITLEEA